MLLYRLKIFLLRVIGYEKPLRVAILKYLSLKYKQFRPNYETIMFESCLEAKKLNYKEITILELGVAGGNGIISLEKYKKKIQKILDIKINIVGFDYGEGLPNSKNKYDLPFQWKMGQYKVDKNSLKKKINSKIFYGDIKDTIKDFANTNPKNISCIMFDLDFYTSTKNFLDQILLIESFLTPRVFCYFDDVFSMNHWINEHNGELLAIKEFNKKNSNLKLGLALDNVTDFKFPLAKNQLFIMHNFIHEDYNKFIGIDTNDENTIAIGNKKVSAKIF